MPHYFTLVTFHLALLYVVLLLPYIPECNLDIRVHFIKLRLHTIVVSLPIYDYVPKQKMLLVA